MELDRITGRYTFTVAYEEGGYKRLSIYGYAVGLYPLTYGVLDCLEHFCDGNGLEFVKCKQHDAYPPPTITGMVTLERSFGAVTFLTTFRAAGDLYQNDQRYTR